MLKVPQQHPANSTPPREMSKKNELIAGESSHTLVVSGCLFVWVGSWGVLKIAIQLYESDSTDHPQNPWPNVELKPRYR